jgi:hypothetical protein
LSIHDTARRYRESIRQFKSPTVQRFKEVMVQIVQAVQPLRSVEGVIWRTAVQDSRFNGNVENVKNELGSKGMNRQLNTLTEHTRCANEAKLTHTVSMTKVSR